MKDRPNADNEEPAMAKSAKAAAKKAGGRKKASAAQTDIEGDKAVKAKDVMQVPNDNRIEKDFKELGTLKKSARSAAGYVGEKVKNMVDKHHYDKKAVAIVDTLDKMPVERFRITWPHILKYAQALKFDERAAEQPDMFHEEGEEPEGTFGGREVREPRVVAGTDVDENATTH